MSLFRHLIIAPHLQTGTWVDGKNDLKSKLYQILTIISIILQQSKILLAAQRLHAKDNGLAVTFIGLLPQAHHIGQLGLVVAGS